jgi:hypothetical protein
MLAIGNTYNVAHYALMALSILPLISFFGTIFTHDGRAGIRANPFIVFYYIIFFTFAYFFWTSPLTIYQYIGLNYLHQKLIYGALCIVPILEKGLPN